MGKDVSPTHVYPMQKKSMVCFNELVIDAKKVAKGPTAGKGRRRFPIASTGCVNPPRNLERWMTRTHCRDPKELPVHQLRTEAALREYRLLTLIDLERAI